MLEALGVKSGAISTGKLVILLKMLGIDYIFGTNNSSDMNDNINLFIDLIIPIQFYLCLHQVVLHE